MQSRRSFLRLTLLSSAVFLTSGCDLIAVITPKETLRLLQEELFPKVKELGINTSRYMEIIFAHSRITQEEKEFLKCGVKKLNEAAYESYGKHFTSLTTLQRKALLNTTAKTQWGAAFMDAMLRYTLEALLGDPIYGANIDEAGWKWLAYTGAKPQPTKAYL